MRFARARRVYISIYDSTWIGLPRVKHALPFFTTGEMNRAVAETSMNAASSRYIHIYIVIFIVRYIYMHTCTHICM